jgi:tRNA (uracil-5-)-methyltransferase TRM9
VFVWALEQDGSRRGYSKEKDEQDQLVPWVLKGDQGKRQKKQKHTQTTDFGTHTQSQQQISETFKKTSSQSSKTIIQAQEVPPEGDDAIVSKSQDQRQHHTAGEDQTYHRYYHLYTSGELESECISAGGRIIDAGYEKDNWWCIVEPDSGFGSPG